MHKVFISTTFRFYFGSRWRELSSEARLKVVHNIQSH